MGKHVHQFGAGYYDLLNGSRVQKTQVCTGCPFKLVTDLTKHPEPKDYRANGMKPGGTFSGA